MRSSRVGRAPAEEGSNDLGERHVLSLSAASRAAQAPEREGGDDVGPIVSLGRCSGDCAWGPLELSFVPCHELTLFSPP